MDIDDNSSSSSSGTNNNNNNNGFMEIPAILCGCVNGSVYVVSVPKEHPSETRCIDSFMTGGLVQEGGSASSPVNYIKVLARGYVLVGTASGMLVLHEPSMWKPVVVYNDDLQCGSSPKPCMRVCVDSSEDTLVFGYSVDGILRIWAMWSGELLHMINVDEDSSNRTGSDSAPDREYFSREEGHIVCFSSGGFEKGDDPAVLSVWVVGDQGKCLVNYTSSFSNNASVK